MEPLNLSQMWDDLAKIQREFNLGKDVGSVADKLITAAVRNSGSKTGLLGRYATQTGLQLDESHYYQTADSVPSGQRTELETIARNYYLETNILTTETVDGEPVLVIPLSENQTVREGVLILAGRPQGYSELDYKPLVAMGLGYTAIFRRNSIGVDSRFSLAGSNVGTWNWDLVTNQVIYSQEWKRQLGHADHEISDSFDEWHSRVHPLDLDRATATARLAIEQRASNYVSRFRMRHRDGSWRSILASGFVISDAMGRPIRMMGVHVDITEQSRLEEASRWRDRILEQQATGKPLSVVLQSILEFVEFSIPNTYCSLLQLEQVTQQLRVTVPNRLPPTYNQAIDGVTIGLQVGSCGTAAYRRKTVIVADIDQDPLWVDFREIATAHGLRSCWSVPIFATEQTPDAPREVLGTFALYKATPSTPTPEELQIVEQAANLAGIAMSRDKAERALRESRERFQALVDHAADAIFLHEDTNIIEVNQRACENLGYTREELIGQSPTLFDPDLTPELLAAIRPKLAAGETVAFDVMHRRKDGSRYPAEVRVRPFWFGGRRFSVSIVRDMTERNKAVDALRTSQRFIERIAQASPLIMYVFDITRRQTIYANRQAAAELGYSIEEITSGKNGLLFQIMHPDDLSSLSDKLSRWSHAADGEVISTEYRLRHVDGKWHWFLGRDTVFSRDSSGKVTEIIGTAQDITAWKEAETTLRDSEARLRLLLENLDNVAVQGYEPDGTITFWNKASERLYGYPAADALGKDLVELLHPPSNRAAERELMCEILATGKIPPAEEVEVTDSKGQRRWVFANRALHARPDRSPEFFCFDVDITDRKLAEEQLAMRQSELLHASRLSTVGQMVAGLSHEVAQPLSAIGNLASAGVSQLSREMRSDLQSIKEYFEIIAKQNERCGGILQRLRDFSRRTPTNLVRCPLNQILQESVQFVSQEFRRLQVAVQLQLPEDVEDVRADRIQLEQVVVNLLTNALDAAHDCEPARRKVIVRSWLDSNHSCFSVTDFGVGLGEHRQRLFEPFFTTKPNGMGIGLSIVKSIVQELRGEISAENNDQGGATFLVRLPIFSEKLT